MTIIICKDAYDPPKNQTIHSLYPLTFMYLWPCLHEGRVTLALGLTVLFLVSQGENK
jgi:hypothetical protein